MSCSASKTVVGVKTRDAWVKGIWEGAEYRDLRKLAPTEETQVKNNGVCWPSLMESEPN